MLFAEPPLNLGSFGMAAVQAPGRLVREAAEAGPFYDLVEDARALVGIGRAVETAVGKLAEPALEQVGGGDAGPGGVVGEDCGHVEIGQPAAQVDDREAATAQGPGDVAILDPRNNAVAAPLLEPGRRGIVQMMPLQVDRPGTAHADVVGDAAQESAAIAARRFDQQGHTGVLAEHGKSVIEVTPKNYNEITKNINEDPDKPD